MTKNNPLTLFGQQENFSQYDKNRQLPLQEYFKLTTLAPYRKVLLIDLGFRKPVLFSLGTNGIYTLAQLLELSPQNLSQFGIGRIAQYSVFGVLENFFEEDSEIFPAKTVRYAAEELDPFLIEAIMKNDPQVNLLITALENFSLVSRRRIFLHEFFLPRFERLSVELLDKHALPFLRFGGFAHDKAFDAMPDELTLAELPEYLEENDVPFDLDKMEIFTVDLLNLDMRTFAKVFFDTTECSERELEILKRRVADETLEEIGNDLGITRERVRQIEKKIVRLFEDTAFDGFRKIVHFLQAMNDEKSVFTLDDGKKFLDDEDAETVWFFAERMEWHRENFYFNHDVRAFALRSVKDFDANELLKDLPVAMEEKVFNATIERLAQEKNYSAELLKLKLMKTYSYSGHFFRRERLNVNYMCDYILKKFFPDGYKIADEKSYERFMVHMKEIFGPDEWSTQRNVDTRISEVGVLCGRGKYIHPSFVHVPQEILDRVKKFVDESSHTAIFYKEIFESLKEIFVGTQITNHYFLQGVLKQNDFPYILRKDYLTKDDEINMRLEFDKYLKERGEVTFKELKEHFAAFKDSTANAILMRSPQILRIDDGLFMHASRLNLREEDFEPIKNFLQETCVQPVSTRLLINLFQEKFADFMTRNQINKHRKLFAVLQYMFRDEFTFSRPYISSTETGYITNKRIILQMVDDAATVNLDVLAAACKKKAVKYFSRSYLSEFLRPEFVRVDERTSWQPEALGVTSEIILAVVETVRAAMARNGGWQAASAFNDYDKLPTLEKPWNSFLLESLATLVDDELYVLKNPYMAANVSSKIFVTEDFAEDDLKTFMTKILTVANEKKPFASEEEILLWLQVHGLCGKKLPKFFTDGKALKLLNVGKLPLTTAEK